jgi:sodium/proline symporter
VCWTDLVQGSLMFVAIIIVPLTGHFGGAVAEGATLAQKGLSMNPLVDGGKTISLVAIISTAAWGLGYFGQPHILARFMGIRSISEIPKSITIATVWVTISLAGAVAVGLVAIPIYPELRAPDHEKVFIYIIRDLFNPWVSGVLLAAILSAIMSTIDSQLLVSSSTLIEDIYRRVIRREATEKELMLVGRICVLAVSVVAFLLALDPESTVLGLVAYAWGGFGAAFGPLVLVALFSRRTTWKAALGGMVAGTVVLVLWKELGYGKTMYEIVPGFVVNLVTIFLLNLVFRQRDPAIDEQFEEVEQALDQK